MNDYVVAGILNTITESLYDRPIVVFREYIQNSVDSFSESEKNTDDLKSKIWECNGNLYFLDNGSGVSKKEFFEKMKKIGGSEKRKRTSIGYKGIGRLSGIPYCKKLKFVNICSYSRKEFQVYEIDCEEYNRIKKTEDYHEMSFEYLIELIGSETMASMEDAVCKVIEKESDFFDKIDTGFLVVLEEIKPVLIKTIHSEKFISELEWLLPVDFAPELYCEGNSKKMFEELVNINNSVGIHKHNIVQSYNISFNDYELKRPIRIDMLRDYQCKFNLKYANGFICFNSDRITISKANEFYGIRIYMDNILLCTENEFIPILKELGYLEQGIYELIQSVKGIGAMIYIADKENISVNARRTFIEIVDSSSLEFLELLAKVVVNVFDARYALSKYYNLKNKVEENQNNISEKLSVAKEKARNSLAALGNEIIEVDDYSEIKFSDLDDADKRKIIKQSIQKKSNLYIKEYMENLTCFNNIDTAFNDYVTWIISNIEKK